MAVATMLLASCGQAEPTGTDESGSTSEPQSGPTSTPTPTPALTPTPVAKLPGFDFEVTQGTFWKYQWSYMERSCAQGSGCSTKEDEGLYRVTLGPPREIQGVTAYEIQLIGKHKVALPDVTRDFAPRWGYLAVSDNRIHGSSGSGLAVIFDGQLGKWAGSGYFTDRFNADELIEANSSSITQDTAIADWTGVRTGPAISIGRASSQSQCEIIAGIRVCPREETFNLLLLTPSETTSEDTLLIDGKETELVDLSTASDPVETISATLSAGEYFIGIQAFLTRARTDYVLTIE